MTLIEFESGLQICCRRREEGKEEVEKMMKGIENTYKTAAALGRWRAACIDCDWSMVVHDAAQTARGAGLVAAERADQHCNDKIGDGYGHTAIVVDPKGGVERMVRCRWGE